MATITQLNTKARSLVDADTTSWTAANLLIDINAAYEEVVAQILGFDGNFQFDDSNYTDFPVGKADLVATQKDYSFDTAHLFIEAVEVMDENGDYYYLKPLDKFSLSEPWDEYFSTDGRPEYYDKEGNSLILGPGPATGKVTTSYGLKVHFRRTADVFTSAQVTTGTKQPGFASPCHYLLSYKAALGYAQSYKKDRVPMIMSNIERLEVLLEKIYTRRAKDEKDIMTVKSINFR